MNLKKIKCVILDFDDTLYSNGDWSTEGEVFGGYLVKENLLTEYPTIDEKLNYLKSIYPEYHTVQCIFAYLHDNGIDDSSFRKYNEENICEIRGKDIVFIEPKYISNLAKGFKVYLLSDSFRNYLDFYLNYAKIDKTKFQDIVSNQYNDEKLSKIPMMKKILEDTGLKANEIVMVGDSEKADIIPAKLLGFQTYHVKDVFDTQDFLQKLIDLRCTF